MVTALLTLLLAADPTIRLAPGAQEILRVPGLTRVALSAPEVADITPTNSARGELLLVGKQRGRSSLTLWTATGVQTRQIIVDDGKTTELGRMVKELVSPTLHVEQFNGSTVIDGTLDSVEELRRLERLVGEDSSVKLLVKLNPRVLPIVAEQMNAAFKKQGLANARAQCVGQTIFLDGSVGDEAELKKALLIANAIYTVQVN
jgi:hypothetical protein